MLTSLFGDLGLSATPGVQPRAASDDPNAFAATALLDSSAAEVNPRGQIVDRHLRDLFVTGSPAQAMREHFAGSRAEPERGGKWIVLLDPARVWASAVVKALSDAGGQPVDRLHLREHGTLRTLALIERTVIVRRLDESLKVYHADVRASGAENAEISLALTERAQLTAVIVGPMQPHAIDALLNMLHDAASQPTWRCPTLLFLLPPGAVWIANKVAGIAWPHGLAVEVLNESMTGASAVWNAVLGVWTRGRHEPPPPSRTLRQPDDDFPVTLPGLEPAQAAAAVAPLTPPLHVPPLQLTPHATPSPAAPASAVRTPATVLEPDARPVRTSIALDSDRAARALSRMAASTDGLLACAIVEAQSGLVLAYERRDAAAIDIELAAAACAQALRAQRTAGRSLGLTDTVDELLVGAGARQLALRMLSRHAQLFVFALLDRNRTNLALARLRLLELESNLGA